MAEWWTSNVLLTDVATAVQAGEKVLVIAANAREARNMERNLRRLAVDPGAVKFVSVGTLEHALGLRVDRVLVDDYARFVASTSGVSRELEYIERTVTL